MARKRFSEELKLVGLSKARLARALEISPEQVSRWGDAPPAYARAYLDQLKRNIEIQAKLDAFLQNTSNAIQNPLIKYDKYQSLENKYNHINEVINRSQSAIAVFTRGMHLEIRSNNTGYSGNWVVDPDKEIDKIVLYKRDENVTPPVNEIMMADYVWGEGPLEGGRRYRIHFKNLEKIGVTDCNWKEFTDGGANPVQYFNIK